MFLLVPLFVVIGTVAAREPDIDINRIRLLSQEAYQSNHALFPGRRSAPDTYQFKTNDYDDHSSIHLKLREPLHIQSSNGERSTKAPVKVYQPREDPRHFYQSDTYLKESHGQNVNHEVSFIYPGKETIRARDNGHISLSLRVTNPEHNIIYDGSNFCVRCPHDRTVIAKPGTDRILLKTPRLFSCSGLRSPKSYHFVHMYGPKFGSLISAGSHIIIGRIVYGSKSIHLCKMQVHVVVQGCPMPKYLMSHCENMNKMCNFTCRDPKLEIHGLSSQTCGEDMKWMGELPVCRARTWCEPPLPPAHGTIGCKGAATTGAGYGLVEGSKCRVRCAAGWHGHPRPVTVCRRGVWTNPLTCQRTNKLRNS